MSHALFSPSSAHRWMHCPGSVVLCQNLPDTSSSYAEEGTQAHELAAAFLTRQDLSSRNDPEDMLRYVTEYADYVNAVAAGGELHVEVSVPVGLITGEKDATGTADAIVMQPSTGTLYVIDLKYGRGHRVAAEGNEQLALYAAAAMAEYDLIYDIKRVVLVIHQPRISAVPDEWETRPEVIRTLAEDAARAAGFARYCMSGEANTEDHLVPGEDQCRFCRAKATCPALTAHVLSTVADDFVDISKPVAPQLTAAAEAQHDGPRLANLLRAVPLIEDWCKSVSEQAYASLAKGCPVPGYKLVAGKRGARQWRDPEEAVELFKAMRLRKDDMYSMKLISPTEAEKLQKAGTIGPRSWHQVEKLIVQPAGRPTIAPETDKRPALQGAIEDFDVLEDP